MHNILLTAENVKDMCQKTFELKQSNRIFLSSPGYPSRNGFTEESCECSIRGTSITSITILDLTLKTSSDGVRSNLFIQYGDITYNQASRDNSQPPLQVYNHRLQTTTTPTTAADLLINK
ncbi:hypothetical protein SNE40_017630 [Patella caerulea]|uniref:Uncharacterized protein n=1 Tax=Patella caerulea TaxID=87958 RepID=A0AAN8PG58_PATCE